MIGEIERLLGQAGWLGRGRKEGSRWFGPCPIHQGDNPRAFVVDLPGERWYCFTRCRRGGGPGGLAAALNLAKAEQPLSVAPLVRQGFTPFVRRLWLDPNHPWLERKGISAQTASEFEAGYCPGTGMLARSIGVRLHNARGDPLGYAGRRLDPERGKWIFPRGFPKSSSLYGLHRITARQHVVVVECPWGVMRLAQIGVPAVALLGISLSDIQLLHLRTFGSIVALFDGDPAGRAAAKILANCLPVRVAELPDGLDPDDLGDDQLLERVQSSFPS